MDILVVSIIQLLPTMLPCISLNIHHLSCVQQRVYRINFQRIITRSKDIYSFYFRKCFLIPAKEAEPVITPSFPHQGRVMRACGPTFYKDSISVSANLMNGKKTYLGVIYICIFLVCLGQESFLIQPANIAFICNLLKGYCFIFLFIAQSIYIQWKIKKSLQINHHTWPQTPTLSEPHPHLLRLQGLKEKSEICLKMNSKWNWTGGGVRSNREPRVALP